MNIKEIYIDADAKELVCVSPEGVDTRIDYSQLTLDEAYQKVGMDQFFGKETKQSLKKNGLKSFEK